MGPEQPALRETHRGVAYGYMAKRGYYGSPRALGEVDLMADLGVRWVALLVTVMQDAFCSTRVYQDFEFTPSDAELERIIARCRERGIKVMLEPVLECHDSAWRGQVHFPDVQEQIQGRRADYWTPWFAGFSAAMVHYGRLAEATGAELLCLGCELDGTQHQEDHWRWVIDRVRGVYGGPLTYEAGHRPLSRGEVAGWFADLDLLGVSFYFPAADRPGASVAEMVRFLRPQVERLRDLAERVGRPLLFTESGCRSRLGAAVDPGDYRLPGSYSGEEQANFLEALLLSFWPEPWWRGVYWWKWEEQQRRPQYVDDPAGDKGFTLQGKPAENVMRRWYARTDRP